MIELKGVNKSFQQRRILKNINLEITKGETLAIIGASGSGKSTLLRLIIGLLKPDNGEIWIKNKEISNLSEKELNEVRLNMGMVFQYSALFDSMTIGDNVAFGLREHTTLSEAEIKEIVQENLRMVDLEGFENMMPNELSGGMKKRVSLARAIAFKPEILLYDEPSAGLDPMMSAKIDELIYHMQQKLGVTSIVVTHHMNSAFAIADRIAMIHEGEIIAIGDVEMIQNLENPIVQNFIHGSKRFTGGDRGNDNRS
ncbi:ABC transporter ATP-binding protein [Anaerosinus gibii]|uniref:ABC transporter ATP-binding protein n=1 Tax=Selenobaculum gibii TaxID=3054208 RepID=A0A9Y2AIP8_9FIRM|nr:ABC transporter ATP-binding protein [Selenobaculum gbiensis]WIW71022.1 ABC transporter ATP-binding protein [Selenobaculum gbiensis]